MKKLAFIGAGKMAEALLKGTLSAKVFNYADIIASDVSKDRLGHIKQTYQIDVTTDNKEAASAARTVLLAVKPQNIDAVLNQLSSLDLGKKLLISIAAGVTSKHIKEILNQPVNLVRVMPNAPALVGKGISALAIPDDLAADDKQLAINLFNSVGEVVLLAESLINQATALSGSGPAYFFYFVRGLIKAGEEAGLSPEIAAKLVKYTIYGAAEMLISTSGDLSELIAMVASKGGTTEAALRAFDHGKINDIITEGVTAALKRAQELDLLQ